MAGEYKGITVKFGADYVELQTALNTLTKQSKTAQQKLSAVEKALKLDPTNVELLGQRAQYAAEKAEVLRKRLDVINQALAQTTKGTEAYNKLQRELSTTTAQLTKLEAKATAGAKSMATFGDRAATAATKLKGVSSTLAGIGAAMTVGVTTPLVMAAKSIVTTATDFETAMSKVSGALDLPESSMASLNQLALDLGSSTVFSASECADAMLELAKGGLSESQIQAGALSATLDMAAASGLDMATAANSIVQAMGAFDLGAEDADEIANALAGAANASSADVSELMQGLSQCAAQAHNAGWSIQETTAVLAMFADAGVTGSDAGTSLKTMLQRLAAPTGAAETKMEELGVNVRDASGSMRPAGEIAGELSEKMGGLSEAERDAALQTIFGSDASRAATIMMGKGQEAVEAYTDATSDQEAATRMANAALGETGRAIEEAKGALETAAIKLGDAMAPYIQDFAAALSDACDWFLQLDGDTQDFIVRLGFLTAAAGPAATAVSGVTRAAGGIATALGKIAGKGGAGAIEGLGTAGEAASVGIGAAGVALEALLGAATVYAAVGIASELYDEWTYAQDLDTALGGVKTTMDEIPDSAAALPGVLEQAVSDSKEILATAEQLISDHADTVHEVEAAWEGIGSENGELSTYMGVIEELSGKSGLTAEEQNKLKAAVEGVNRICGTSYTVIDEQNGVLSDSVKTIDEAVEAWKRLARVQGYQSAISSYYEDLGNQAVALDQAKKAAGEAAIAYEEASQAFEDAMGISYDDLVANMSSGKMRETDYLNTLTEANAAGVLQPLNEARQAVTDTAGALEDLQGVYDATAAEIEGFEKGLDAASRAGEENYEALLELCDGADFVKESIAATGLTAEEFAAQLDKAGLAADELDVGRVWSFARAYDGSVQSIQEHAERLGIALHETATATEGQGDAADGTSEDLGSLSTSEDAAADAADELTQAVSTLSGSTALSSYLTKSGRSVDQFAAKVLAADKSIDELIATYNSIDSATDPMSTFEAGEMTLDQFVVNMDTNQQAVTDWKKQLVDLYAGAETAEQVALLDYLAELGPEASSQIVSTLNHGLTGGMAEFQSIAEKWLAGEDLDASVAVDTMEASIAAADRTGLTETAEDIGGDVTAAAATGVEDGAGDIADATSGAVADAATEAATDVAQAGTETGDAFADAAGASLSEGVQSEASGAFGELLELAVATNELLAYQGHEGGAGLAANLAAGIREGIPDIAAAASEAAAAAGDYLHHSTPDKGPLAGDDRWGVEMVANFAAGMESRVSDLARAARKAAQAASFEAVAARSSSSTTNSSTTNVYIDGAKINDTPAIRSATYDYLMDLKAKAVM